MPPRRKAASVSRDQQQWLAWSQVREIEADEIAKLYRKQAVEVRLMLTERGRECNPLFQLTMTPKGPSTKEPILIHQLGCQS